MAAMTIGAACSVALAQGTPSGTVDVQLANGQRVSSTLDYEGEIETFRFVAPAGVQGHFELRLLSADGALDVAFNDNPVMPVRDRGRAAVSGGIGGANRIDIRHVAGENVRYTLEFEWGAAQRVDFDSTVAREYTVAAVGGARLRLPRRLLRDLDRSGARLCVDGPPGSVFDGECAPSRAITLDCTGLYTVRLELDDDAAPIIGSIKVSPPKLRRRTLRIKSGNKGAGNSRLLVRLCQPGAEVVAPVSAEGQRFAGDFSGLKVSIDPGQTTHQVPFAVSSSETVGGGRLGGFSPTGPLLDFDFGSAAVAGASTVTSPYDVGAFLDGDEPCVLLLDKRGSTIDELDVYVDVTTGAVTYAVGSARKAAGSAASRRRVTIASRRRVARKIESDRIPLEPDGDLDYFFVRAVATDARGRVFICNPDHLLAYDAETGEISEEPGDFAVQRRSSFPVFFYGLCLSISDSGPVFVGGYPHFFADDHQGMEIVPVVYRFDDDKPYSERWSPLIFEGFMDVIEAGGLEIVVTGIAVDDASGTLYFRTLGEGLFPGVEQRVYAVPVEGGSPEAVVGGAGGRSFSLPPLDYTLRGAQGLAVDRDGALLISDETRIIRVDLKSGTVERLAGTIDDPIDTVAARQISRALSGFSNDGAALDTIRFESVRGLNFDARNRDFLYAADAGTGLVWRLDLKRNRGFVVAGRSFDFVKRLEELADGAPRGDFDPRSILVSPISVAAGASGLIVVDAPFNLVAEGFVGEVFPKSVSPVDLRSLGELGRPKGISKKRFKAALARLREQRVLHIRTE